MDVQGIRNQSHIVGSSAHRGTATTPIMTGARSRGRTRSWRLVRAFTGMSKPTPFDWRSFVILASQPSSTTSSWNAEMPSIKTPWIDLYEATTSRMRRFGRSGRTRRRSAAFGIGRSTKSSFERCGSWNASLPAERQLRVLLGDPPIDWDRIRQGKDDAGKWTPERDHHAVGVIRREVIAKDRRALVIYGGGHLFVRVNCSSASSNGTGAGCRDQPIVRVNPVNAVGMLFSQRRRSALGDQTLLIRSPLQEARPQRNSGKASPTA